jgi:hypothetical protein
MAVAGFPVGGKCPLQHQHYHPCSSHRSVDRNSPCDSCSLAEPNATYFAVALSADFRHLIRLGFTRLTEPGVRLSPASAALEYPPAQTKNNQPSSPNGAALSQGRYFGPSRATSIPRNSQRISATIRGTSAWLSWTQKPAGPLLNELVGG